MTKYWGPSAGGSSTGTWDASSVTNWFDDLARTVRSTVAPTSADDVVFDAASDAGAIFTVTVGTGAVCRDITAGSLDFTMTLAGSAAWSIYGSLTFPATNFTQSYSGAITFAATTTGKTITTNGKVLSSGTVTFSGAGGDWTLGSALTVGNFAQSNGTFDVSASNYQLTCSGSGFFKTGGTFVSRAGTITVAAVAGTFNGQATTFYNVEFTSSSAGTHAITGANTFNNLTFTSLAATGIRNISISANQTINGTLTLGAANTAIRRVFVYSDVIGIPRTITANTIATLSDVDFRNIVAAGASGTWAGTRLGNCLGNSNITFDAGKTVYWNLAGIQNWAATGWALTNNGTPAANNFPLAQDTATFTEAGSVGTISQEAGWNIGTITMADGVSNRTSAFTLNASSMQIYGNLILFNNLIFNTFGTLTFAKQGGTQTIISAGKTITQPTIVNAPTGTLQLADALTTSGQFTLTSGTVDLNGFDLTVASFLSNNSNTRSIAFGANSINLPSNNNTIWSCGTITGFSYTGTPTINCTYSGSTGTRAIVHGSTGATESNAVSFFITAGSDTINNGNQTYVKNLNFTGFSGTWNVTNINNFGDVVLSSGMTLTASANAIQFSKTAGIQTVTTNGKTIGNVVTKFGAGTLQLADALTTSAIFTLNTGTLDLNGFDLTALAFSSDNSNVRSIAFGANKISITRSGGDALLFDNATNYTHTGTPRIEFTYSGSVGTRFIFAPRVGANLNYLPDLYFLSGSDTVNQGNGNANIGNLDFTGFSGSFVWGGGGLGIAKSLVYSATMTVISNTQQFVFNGVSGTQTITTNGKTLDFPITKSGTGTLQLADALTMGSTRTLSNNAGTIDLNGKTLTVGAYSSTGVVARSIAFNSGSIVDLGAWTASGSNFTTSGVGTISMTSASAKTFAGGGISYPTLNQGGAGALSITGANTFADITNTVQPATVTFPASTTTNVAAFSLAGTVGNLITLNSSSAGTRATLNKTTGGALTRSYLSIQDSAATPAQVWFAGSTSTNVSNNTGWIFADLAITTETTTLTDTTDTTGIFVADIIESEALTDAYTTQVDFAGTQNETIILTDTPSSLAVYVASQTDTQTLSDSSVGNATYPNTVTDTMTVSDSMQGLLIYDLQITESTTLTEAQSAVFFFSGAVAELMFLDASQASLAIYNSAINEPIHITDRQASFGWFPVDTTQNAGWVDINNTQV